MLCTGKCGGVFDLAVEQPKTQKMGDFNLFHIDWSLQLPTPASGSKLLQFIADNGLSQHVLGPTTQNNILDLVITTEEALIVTLQIKDKIGQNWQIKDKRRNSCRKDKLQFPKGKL